MQKRNIQTTQTYSHSVATIWPILSDFFTPWHPYISWCEQIDDRTRRFGMPGEEMVYIEQITAIDHDCHRFSYVMLQGIDGIESYRGTAYIEAISANESRVIWEAEITGPEQITRQVAEGTEAVFNAGLDELARILTQRAIKTTAIKPTVVEGDPQLAVDVGGVDVGGVDVGGEAEGKDELALFLHGIGGGRRNWHGQLAALAPLCQAVALDFRGYGESELGPVQPTVANQVEDIQRVMRWFGTEKVHLVGLSYGSWIAACFAHLHPQRVASLTCCAGSTGMSEAGKDEIDRFRQLRLAPMEAGQTPADIAEDVVDFISGPAINDAARKELLASMVAVPRETYIAALRCFLEPPFQIGFENFDFPTQFIAGTHDMLAPPDEMKDIANRVPNSAFSVIENAGHLVNLEQPERFNHVLVQFIRGQLS